MKYHITEVYCYSIGKPTRENYYFGEYDFAVSFSTKIRIVAGRCLVRLGAGRAGLGGTFPVRVRCPGVILQ